MPMIETIELPKVIVDILFFYGLFEQYDGKGYATEIAKAIINYSFSKVGLNRIVATVNEDNDISKKILNKIGMKFEYVIDDKELDGYDGELMYAINKEQYK